MKLIECVPNFSEGRDRSIIDAVTATISGTEGAVLLDVDPGAATNRTVVTFIGPPEAVEEAAFRAISKATELIDMSRHQGEHPRMGATDVCPFIPVQGATMEDCIGISRRLARRVGEELQIPVYLYGHAATRPERQALPDIRKGEYEALAEKLKTPDFAPDSGPARFVPRSGATVIGARSFLIAWNVNLNTRDRKLANRIAGELRETGKPRRDAEGEIVRDSQGVALRDAGRFQALQGAGWYIAEYGRAQVSFNLTDLATTAMHQVFDACREEAGKIGLRVTGSELVGLVPLEAMLATGDHYLALQGKTRGVAEAERIHAAILSLGLDDLTPFLPQDKIIEYRYRGPAHGLVAQTLKEFADELASDSPAPGGGSVAALCGALSASLSSMVAALTWSKKGMEDARTAMQDAGCRAQALKEFFLQAVDRDTEAFNAVLTAIRLPQLSAAEQQTRQAAMQAANIGAAQVPLEVLEQTIQAMDLALQAARDGNPSSASDAGVAGACALAAAEGAALNVRINLPSIADEAVRGDMARRTAATLEKVRGGATAVQQALAAVMEKGQG